MRTIKSYQTKISTVRTASRKLSGPRFRALLVRGILEKIHKSYTTRAQGLPDDQGQTWKPLAPSTVARRVSRRRRGSKHSTRPRSRQTVSYDPEPTQEDYLILRDTNRLYESFRPGSVVHDQYIPPNSDQQVEITQRSITIGSRVPYATQPTQDRPIFTEEMRPWIDESIEETIDILLNGLEQDLK